MIRQKRGKIINIASVSAHSGRPENIAYCASKGGILQLTRTNKELDSDTLVITSSNWAK